LGIEPLERGTFFHTEEAKIAHARAALSQEKGA
jgi:hypothetical protein